MSKDKFPTGWDDAKIKKVIAHYGEQTEDEAVAEDEAGVESSEAVMKIPHDLISTVRELIARRQS